MPQPARGFTDEYAKLIEEYFSAYIKKKQGISPNNARAFLRKYPSEKTYKQIQDKVRNFFRYQKD